MFIKTEADSLINTDYIRVIFIDKSGKRANLMAEMDNSDHYVLATTDDPRLIDVSMDELLTELNKEMTQ